MGECKICTNEVDGEDIGWCDVCSLFAPLLVGHDFEARPKPSDRIDIETVLGPHRDRTSHARWRSLLSAFDGEDIEWTFNPMMSNPELTDPFPINDSVIESGLQLLRQTLCGRNSAPQHVVDHLLQRGIPLGDGHWISRLGDNWAYDGKPLIWRVPHEHIIRALTGTRSEKTQAKECDWPKLLMMLSIVSQRSHRRDRGRYDAHEFDQNMFFRRRQPRPELFEGARLFMMWLEWTRVNHLEGGPRGRVEGGQYREMRARVRWERRRFRELGIQAGSNGPLEWDRLLSLDMPWVSRWKRVFDEGNYGRKLNRWGGRSLSIRKGKVHLRVIKDGRWIWTPLPPWPKLWALLVSWALSPPESPEHLRLRALQWMWHNSEGELMPSEPDCRALNLLKEVCDDNDNLTLSDAGGSIYVQGTSGLFYSVSAGPGAHGARFRVEGANSLEAIHDQRGEPLCIHEERGGPTLPVGDILVTVVLSLVDDLRSSENLAPLHAFVGRNMAQAGRQGVHDPIWLRRQRQRFMHPPVRGRWLRVFPRLYDALIHMPIGTRIRVPQEVPCHLTVDDAMFAVHLNTVEEIELAEGLFRLTGWRRDGEFDEDGNRVWRRVDAPVQRVRHNLVELLGPFERRHGRPGDPPWWNLFRDAIGPNDLPQAVPERFNQQFGGDDHFQFEPDNP